MGNAEIVEQWTQAVGGDWELLRRVPAGLRRGVAPVG